MNAEEINIAIAEICGLCHHPFDQWEKDWDMEDETYELCCKKCGQYLSSARAPDYHGSLDAIHGAVMTLDYDGREHFEDELCDVAKRENDAAEYPAPWRFAVSNATAEQRCEAFLRVHNKWKEAP